MSYQGSVFPEVVRNFPESEVCKPSTSLRIAEAVSIGSEGRALRCLRNGLDNFVAVVPGWTATTIGLFGMREHSSARFLTAIFKAALAIL